ncbi:MAG TPA: SIMPL domain-containing protein [bacterium]|nr:SIMPL domain-containing protein [bacterium]
MRKTGVRLAALAAVAVLLGNSAGAPPARAQVPAPAGARPASPGQTIVVIGQGAVEAVPDRATIDVGSQVTRPTAQDAQQRTSATMTQIIDRIMALGIPRDRIHTVEINLFPQRRPPSEEISGYQAVQRATVTVDDLSMVGRVVDAAVAAGGNLVGDVTFTLRDPAAFRARALAAAVQDARATANVLAAAAGVTILRVVRIEEFGAATPVPRVGLQAAPAASTPVLPGTLTVSTQVRAIFAF